MKHFICTILLLPFVLSAHAQLTEANYRVYSVKLDKEVPLNVVAEDLINYDVLLFGEEHNDSVSHYIEKTLFTLLSNKYADNLALSLEMFDRDVQPVMDEFLKGFIKEKHFIKDARAWTNYRDYKPMVDFARENNIDIICANAPGRYANLAGRKGQAYLKQLPSSSKDNFAPLPYEVATGNYYAKLMGVGEHATGAATTTATDTARATTATPAMGGFDLVTAQSLWDATMAYSINQYKKKNKDKKIMHVNGKFHSDEGFAVATQLLHYNPKVKRMIVSSISDDTFPRPDWSKYKKYGDYIIITDPKVPRTYSE